MKGKQRRNITGAAGQLVWVEFASPGSASGENCGACGTAQLINEACVSGVYRARGQFLTPVSGGGPTLHEYNPRIVAFYEWLEG